MDLEAPQPLSDQHRTAGFDCGDTSLNHWLQQRALANQRSGDQSLNDGEENEQGHCTNSW